MNKSLLPAPCLIAPLILAISGCNSSTPNTNVAAPMTRDEIGAGTAPPASTNLVQAGLTIPAELKFKRDGDRINIDSGIGGAVIERESYLDLPDRFELAQAAEESFQPPIDLIRYPFISGHSSRWSGTMISGKSSLDANGTITADMRNAYLGGVQRKTIHVDVVLTMKSQSGSALPQRRMSFDFVIRGGLQGREFGEASRREPRSTP